MEWNGHTRSVVSEIARRRERERLRVVVDAGDVTRQNLASDDRIHGDAVPVCQRSRKRKHGELLIVEHERTEAERVDVRPRGFDRLLARAGRGADGSHAQSELACKLRVDRVAAARIEERVCRHTVDRDRDDEMVCLERKR